jgi:rubrerythrin
MSDKKSLLDLFEENELNVSRLYQIYAEKFSEHARFWQILAQEEIGHAEQLAVLRTKAELQFIENNFARGIVAYVLDFVKTEIAKAESGDVSYFDAVNVAMRIEQSILEKKYFDFFQSSDKLLNEVFGVLNNETGRHLKMLQEKFAKLERKRKG